MFNKKCFTLIELMVVIAVIGILVALLLPQVGKIIDRARIARIEAALKTLKTATIKFYGDCGGYPRDVAANRDPGFMTRPSYVSANDWDGPYLDRWPSTIPIAGGGYYDYNYWGYGAFNFDGTLGNEVHYRLHFNRGSAATRRILQKIDSDLDDGNRNAGSIRHDNWNNLYMYVAEGPSA